MSAEPDSEFFRSFAKVIATLVGVTILLIVIANSLFGDEDPAREALAKERATENLSPSFAVRLSGEPAPALASADQSGESAESGGVTEVRSGEQVTQAVCIACHQGNFLNAPAVGDAGAWGERIDKGWETLVGNVTNGYGNMPAQGGAASEEEIRAAIEWMVESETGLDVPES